MTLFLPEDVLETTRTGNKVGYEKDYNLDEFWREYGKFYIKTFFVDGIVKTIGKEIDEKGKDAPILINIPPLIGRIKALGVKTALEVGCGFGRILPFLIANTNLERLVGVDFSPTMVENSKGWLNAFKDDKRISVQQADARELPFKDKEFELVYTHVCLTHIPPKYIPKITSEISRVAEKYILHVERYNYDYEHPNHHRWSHKLPPFYLDLGWEIFEYDMLNENEKHYTKILVLKRPGGD